MQDRALVALVAAADATEDDDWLHRAERIAARQLPEPGEYR